jgi:hypothetical protein
LYAKARLSVICSQIGYFLLLKPILTTAFFWEPIAKKCITCFILLTSKEKVQITWLAFKLNACCDISLVLFMMWSISNHG